MVMASQLRYALTAVGLCTLLLGCGGGGDAPPVTDPGDNSNPPAPAGDRFSFTLLDSSVGLPVSNPFTEPTTTQGYTGGGLAAVDVDGDGFVDIYVVAKGDEPNQLFLNNGDGTFTESAADFGLDLTHNGSGPTFADIDGDGDRDLFLGGLDGAPYYLMRNDAGTFVDITASSGLILTAANTFSAAFSDYDLDGDLDLFLSHWSTDGAIDTETLWRNRGDGTFESYSVESGIAAQLLGDVPGVQSNQDLIDHTFTPNLSDIDNDGDPDLLYASDFGTSRSFLNNGDGTFSLIVSNEPVLTDEFGMGAAVGDYDNDGDMDWFVTSIFGTVNNAPATGNRLYRNDGLGNFEDVTEVSGVRDGHWGWGACFADLDNDGHLDIFHTNGWTLDDYTNDPALLLHANGDGTFTERAIELRVDDRDQGRGVGCFDFDRDGDQDLVIYNNSENRLRFYRNNLVNDNHYLTVRLRSETMNTLAIGARVVVTTDDGTLVRELRSGSNFVSQNPSEIHVGLGAEDVVDVAVQWPDGRTSGLSQVQADQMLTLVQPSASDFRVTVMSGTGDGSYETGDVVDITADTASDGYHFSHWTSTGAVGVFADPLSSSTTFTVPDTSVTITANYIPGAGPAADVSVARRWNEVLLQAIRNDFARPTVHARNLFQTSSAMYDVWSLFDPVSVPWLVGRTRNDVDCVDMTPADVDDVAARAEAVSVAAYRLIQHRFSAAPGFSAIRRDSNALAGFLGIDLTGMAQADSGRALGEHIADCYIAYGLTDNANESQGYANTFYEPVNPPLQPEEPGNPDIVDLSRWQPLTLSTAIDQAGNVVDDTPSFLGAEWGIVTPFALSPADLTIYNAGGDEFWVYHDPVPPPLADGSEADLYRWAFSLVAVWGAHLDPADGVMIDISPASVGNIASYPATYADYDQFYDLFDGGDPSPGHVTNPVTGGPYSPQIVPRGDYGRVLAEFWADGPESETPPGHWFVIANTVNEHPLMERRFEGMGAPLDRLDWDILTYFMLGGAMHDSAIAAWGIKGYYDYIRPVSALRALADLGQSSDDTAASYHEEGIPLIDDYIELVAEGDPLAGEDNEHVGKIKFYSWRGPDYIGEDGEPAGVGWILAEHWWPYQRPSFVTPPFAGFVSGHSTYSRAAAEVLTALTGDPFFPGGMSGFEAPQDEFLVFERGPSMDITLQWATYRDAADQCSLSRIWGGIHPPVDDIPGRVIGEQVGTAAYARAVSYIDGTAAD
tara:strand:+ start:1304 stop:5008 length:3705 start_codon:yes stop_codon:yes gene_type:complete